MVIKLVKYVTKAMYMREKREYEGWAKLIKFLSFGRLNVDDIVEDLLNELVIVNI